jgi:EmrB/QacA subfamily drug resistance transporter
VSTAEVDAAKIQSRRWLILSVLIVCMVVVILDNTILNVALRTIQEDLNASQSQMQWAIDAYVLVFAGMMITFGVLGDRLGRKRVLLFGMLLFGAMSALCSFSQNPTQLVIARGLMGIGAAAVQPQTLSIIQNVFEPRERGKAIGLWAGTSGIAIALGPISGGLLIRYFWWGSVFLINVPFVIVGAIAIWFLVPDSKDPNPGKLDPPGVLLSIAALSLLICGIITGGSHNRWIAWDSLGAIGVGALLLALFVVLQWRSTHPTIDIGLFRNRSFSAGAAVLALSVFALMGSTFYVAYFLQAVRGYTPLQAGLALIAVAVAVMIAGPVAARLSARFGPRPIAALGMTIAAMSMVSYSFATATSPQWVIEIAMFGQGTGMGLTLTPATTAVMSSVPRNKAGAGSAVNNTMRQVAAAFGVAILGSLLAVGYRSHLGADTPRDVAVRLDREASTQGQLPANLRLVPLVDGDTSESIGNTEEFVLRAREVLRQRAALAQASGTANRAADAAAEEALDDLVSQSKHSFVTSMHVVSKAAGGSVLVGAIIAGLFLPGRPKKAQPEQSTAPEAVTAGAAT